MDEYADHGAEDESSGDSKIEGSPVNKVEQVKILRICTQFLLLESGASTAMPTYSLTKI